MIVKDYMTKHPVMISPTMSIVEVQNIMAETKVRQLPVIGEGKRLVGLITQETLRIPPSQLTSLNVWEITRYLSNLTAKDLMIKGKDVVTIDQDTTIEEAARVMAEHKIGCLPVLNEDIVVGIITDTDLMAHLMEMLAAPEKSVRSHDANVHNTWRAGAPGGSHIGAGLGNMGPGRCFFAQRSQ